MLLKKLKFLVCLCISIIISNTLLFAQPTACGEIIEIDYELNYPIVTQTPGVLKTIANAVNPFSDSIYYNLQKNDILKGVVYTDPITDMETQHLFLDDFDLSTLESWLSKDAPLTAIIARDGNVTSATCSINELKNIKVSYSYTTQPVPILSYDSDTLEFSFINPQKISSDLIKSAEILLLDNSSDSKSSSVSIGKIDDASSNFCSTQLISPSLSNQLIKDYTHLDFNKVYLTLKDQKSHDVTYIEVKLCEDIWGTEINATDKYSEKLIANLGYDSIEGCPVLKGSELIGFVEVHDTIISSPRLNLTLF